MIRSNKTLRVTFSMALLSAGLGLLATVWADVPAGHGFAEPVQIVNVEFSQGTNMAASVSPDGETLLLAMQGSLWLLPVEGGVARQITHSSIEASQPAWSPDGTRIVFQKFDGHFYQIWTARSDGSDATPLSSGHFDHREPVWVGPRVTFSSDRSGEGSYDIWSIEFSDGSYRRWTRHESDAHSPAWSADARQLAYVTGVGIHGLDLQGNQSLLVAADSGALHAPAWAPDGRGLVYQNAERQLMLDGQPLTEGRDVFPFAVSWQSEAGFYYTADGHILHHDLATGSSREVPFTASISVPRPAPHPREVDLVDVGEQPVRGILSPVMSPDARYIALVALNDVWLLEVGGELQRLTDDLHVVWTLSWAPDGEKIYFSSDRHGDGRPDLYAYRMADGGIERVSETANSRMIFPVIAPDGERFAYIDGEDHSLWVHDLGSGEARRIVGQAHGSNVGRPSWSPDGRFIALADSQQANSRFREGRNLIRMVEVETGDWRFHEPAPLPAQLSERLEGGPSWSPDGQWLAFVMASTLHVMPVDAEGRPTGAARQVSRHTADLPSWSADSRHILYVSNGKLRSVELATLARRDHALALHWQRDVPQQRLHILAGAVWDGMNANLHHEQVVIVENGRIVSMAPAGDEPEAAAQQAGAEFLDASDLTLMPGLWDSHIHPRVQDFTSQWWAVNLAYGITTVLSNGASIYHTMVSRESIEAGSKYGPRLLTSPLYDGNRPFYGHHRVVPDESVLALELEKAAALDMDYLKAYVRAPVSYMQAIAAAAQRMGVPNGSHFLSPGIQSGMGGTTHLSASQRMSYSWAQSAGGQSYDDVLQLYTRGQFDLSSHHTRFNNILGDDPGLLEDPRLSRLMPPNYLPQLQRELATPPTEAQREAVLANIETPLAILAGGGLVTIGSDSPLAWPALGLHAQLRAFSYGMSNHEALQTVTINAARYALLDHELGSISPGKVADLLLVRGNPLEDIRQAADVALVIKGGRQFALDELLGLFPALAED